MTRSKNFTREEVLEKSMPLFWRKGFASTSMRDLEASTGVNKSGLYSEFKDKEDLYLASLAYYILTRGGREILEKKPLGWDNVEQFLLSVMQAHENQKGCFMAFSMRDYALFSTTGKKNIHRHLDNARSLISKNIDAKNINAKKTGASAEELTDIVLMFFTGLALAQNNDGPDYSKASIRLFIDGLKKL